MIDGCYERVSFALNGVKQISQDYRGSFKSTLAELSRENNNYNNNNSNNSITGP